MVAWELGPDFVVADRNIGFEFGVLVLANYYSPSSVEHFVGMFGFGVFANRCSSNPVVLFGRHFLLAAGSVDFVLLAQNSMVALVQHFRLVEVWPLVVLLFL